MNQNALLENSVMIENVVLFVGAGTLLLALILVKRVLKLYQHECNWSRMQTRLLSSDVFQQLQHFTTHHLLNIKALNGESVSFIDQPEKRKLVALYLIGASEYLGKQHGLNSIERQVLAYSILQNEFAVSLDELMKLYIQAKCLNEEANKNSIKMGARALGHWLKKGTPNANLGLQALVN